MSGRRRTWFAWHSWIGLTTGLLLFVICWSGTVAVFSHELDWLVDRRLRAPAAETVAWQEIEENVAAAKPGWSIIAISAPLQPGFAAEIWAADPSEIWHRIYADPASGQILGTTSYFNIQRFFRSLHMSLFIYGGPIFGIPFGFFLVGLLAFVLTVSLVTSLVFYRRFWRGFFKLERHKGPKIFWSDLHKLAGLWSLWFIALITVTGIWYLLEWKVTSEAPIPDPPVAEDSLQQTLPLDALVRRATETYPALEIRTVVLEQRSSGMVELHGQDGAWLVRDRAARVWIDSRDGSTIAIRRAGELSPLHRWIDTADPLHFGNFAGLWSKAIWFLFGIGLSGLCLTGAYLHAKRQARRPDNPHRRVVLAAYGSTGLILLLSAWQGYQELFRYGIMGQLPTVPAGVVAIILCWVTITLSILAWWVRSVR